MADETTVPTPISIDAPPPVVIVENPPAPEISSVPEAPPPADLTPAPSVEATSKGTCKTCKNRLDVYAGENPAKIGTGFCATCGNRQLLKG